MMIEDMDDPSFLAAEREYLEKQQTEREVAELKALLVPEEEVKAFILAAQKQGATGGWIRCFKGEMMVHHPWARALLPGHIYSRDGLAEAGISGVCEYHFDEMFAEVDEDSGPAVHDVVDDL